MRSSLATLLFVGVAASLAATKADADGYLGGLSRAAPYSWTGFYIGAHVGGAWSDADYLSNRVFDTSFGPCDGVDLPIPCDPANHMASSVIGGGQAGARWHMGRWVLGIEGSWTATDLHQTTSSVSAPPGPGSVLTAEYSSELKSIYTGTVQIGHAWDRSLWYVKGGYAGGDLHFNSSVSSSVLPGPFAPGPASTQAHGWTVGTGLESALHHNLSVAMEYDFVRLDADASICTPDFPCTPFALRYADYSADIHLISLRLILHVR